MRRPVSTRAPLAVALAVLMAAPYTAFPQSGQSTDTSSDNSNSTQKKGNQEKDPDAIGDRNVSGKVNFYSLEKEIALGKQLAQQVERQSKVINDPIVAEYVNRIGQ